MDSIFILLFLAWIIFSSIKGIKGVSKGIDKSAQNNVSAKETLAKAHAKIRETATQTEFGQRSERPNPWNDKASGTQWGDMTPTQRGRERARQQNSYPGSGQSSRQNSQQTLQQRLDAAAKGVSSLRNVKEFKQGSERKVKRQETGRGKDYGLSSRHAPQKDQNRHRREDWGQRGGSEIITTKSLLVFLALGFIVLYVLSKISLSDLGF